MKKPKKCCVTDVPVTPLREGLIRLIDDLVRQRSNLECYHLGARQQGHPVCDDVVRQDNARCAELSAQIVLLLEVWQELPA